MKVTMSSEMAIHAVWYMAMFFPDRLVQATDVADGLNVSPSYMVKILKGLAKEGILVSKRGKSGGFRLNRESDQVRLSEIITAVEGDAIEFCCMKEDRECICEECPVHGVMAEASKAALAVMDKITVSDLLNHGWKGKLNFTDSNPGDKNE